MQFIILDLEATCWQGNAMGRRSEVIELAGCRIDGYGDHKDQFQRFVRPVDHPRLSAYCTDLTGISQDQVDKAGIFSDVFPLFMDWVLADDAHVQYCTWGDIDMKILAEECRRHELNPDIPLKAIDLKAQFAKIRGLNRQVGLVKALEISGFEFDGNHHRAMDDTLNTAKLFLHYLDAWAY